MVVTRNPNCATPAESIQTAGDNESRSVENRRLSSQQAYCLRIEVQLDPGLAGLRDGTNDSCLGGMKNQS